jgi:hypothetical protein
VDGERLLTEIPNPPPKHFCEGKEETSDSDKLVGVGNVPNPNESD